MPFVICSFPLGVFYRNSVPGEERMHTCGPLQMFMYSASGTLVRTHSLNLFFALS